MSLWYYALAFEAVCILAVVLLILTAAELPNE